MRFASCLLGLVFVFGCGARSDLKTDFDDGGTGIDARIDSAIPDGGRDAAFDAGRDVGPDAPPPTFEVECSGPVMTGPGDAIEIRAVATVGTLVRGEWLLEEFPPGGPDADIAEPTSTSTLVTPFIPGRFAFRFIASGSGGETASCVSEVFSVDGPPIASCPGGEILAPVGDTVTVMGAGFDDDGPVMFAWEVIRRPSGAATSLANDTSPAVDFIGLLPGSYVLELTVTDMFGATDSCRVAVRLIAPPVIECPTDPILAPTREPVTVTLVVTDDTTVVNHNWDMTSQPATSVATITSAVESRATFTPDRQGTYLLEYTATDSDGLSERCIVTVVGTPTPPTLVCPELVETPPLTTVAIEATAEDDGDTLRYRWDLIEREMGSAAAGPSPRNAAITNFTPDIAGEYRLRVTVTDDDGMTATCETLVVAFVDEGLRIEVFWNTGMTDMDTHLINEDATQWFDMNDDCYYANCDGGDVLEWGAPGDLDNPSLDIDDTNGFGPENINIDEPAVGSYTVGVHAFSGSGDVTVRIYCGGSRTDPEAEIGPVNIARRPGDGRDFWRVADVDILSGSRCTVTERVAPAGGPDIISDNDAMTGL